MQRASLDGDSVRLLETNRQGLRLARLLNELGGNPCDRRLPGDFFVGVAGSIERVDDSLTFGLVKGGHRKASFACLIGRPGLKTLDKSLNRPIFVKFFREKSVPTADCQENRDFGLRTMVNFV